jgi:pullulanase
MARGNESNNYRRYKMARTDESKKVKKLLAADKLLKLADARLSPAKAAIVRPGKKPGVRIIASRSRLAPGGRVFLAFDFPEDGGKGKPAEPAWKVEPSLPGLSISSEGVLQAARDIRIERDTPLKITASWGVRKGHGEITLCRRDPLKARHKVHYFRYDGIFDGWNVWAWEAHLWGKQVEFAEETYRGRLAGVDEENVIIRYGQWAAKETGDVSLKDRDEVFIVQGDSTVYGDFRQALDAAMPKVFSALMDSPGEVTAYLTNVPPQGVTFSLCVNGVKCCTAQPQGTKVVFHLPADFPLRPDALMEVKASRGFKPGIVRMRGILDAYYYPGDDLGVSFSSDSISLRLWAPTASRASLMLYENHNDPDEGGKEIPLSRDDNGHGTWSGRLDRATCYGKPYKYKLTFHPGSPYEKVSYAVDPYAAAVTVNGSRGALIDIRTDPATIPAGWNPRSKPPFTVREDAVIYEAHIRDFTIDPSSGVSPGFGGKYLGLAQAGTTLPGNPTVKTGLDHLKELGITHLHVLPFYDFATVDESRMNDQENPKYNWGYDPKNYNAPEGSYATDPFTPSVRVKELRQMIQALHDKNIRVVMDVVYNHTYDSTPFDGTVPGYFYRTDYLGRLTNGSGCGNEVATERPMVRKFILDSLKHWAADYNLDGFRFDLMGIIDMETMQAISCEMRKIDPTLLIYGEPWNGGNSSLPREFQTIKGRQRCSGFSVFNDNFRNAIRGNNGVPHPERAYVTGEPWKAPDVLKGITGAIDDFTHDPGEAINYVACHDNYVLWDQILAATGHRFPVDPYRAERLEKLEPGEEMFDPRVKRHILAAGIVLTSQGIPFIHAGDEFLRTKFGHHNSYKSPDSINGIRWEWKRDYYQVFQYYQGLIKLRKSHPAFRMRTRQQVQAHFHLLSSPGNTIAFILKNNANGDGCRHILVIYNPETEPCQVKLPPGRWQVVANDREAGVDPVKDGYKTFKGTALVPPLSLLILSNPGLTHFKSGQK